MHTLLWTSSLAETLRCRARPALVVSLLLVLFNLSGPVPHAAASTVTTYTGTLGGGAAYLVEVPSNWNGILVLYSHGYVTPGAANPAKDAGDPFTGGALLAQGFALAGSSYSTTGWAVQQALSDQVQVLDWFTAHVAHPVKTIAWGHSLGGLITAGLIQQHPERFDAALPMCGAVAGGVGNWNQALDTQFALKTLLAPNSPLQLVNIINPAQNVNTAGFMLAGAQLTAQGRARIALASAMADIPGWFDPNGPEPAADDYAGQEANQFLWVWLVGVPFAFAFRAELEARAGGNPSWNTSVNYRAQLAKSIDGEEVRALYKQVGLNLEQDMQALAQAQRIGAHPGALQYLAQYITIDAPLHLPVLTMHTTDDGLLPVQNEQAYARAVSADADEGLLRQVYVHRAGHCQFTPAETLTAFQTLLTRMLGGSWPSLDPAEMNAAAAQFGALNNFPPSFLRFHSGQFLRPFDGPQQMQ